MSRKQGTPGNTPEHIQEHTPAGDVLSFADQVETEFLRLYQLYKVADAPARRQPEIIDTIWRDIYKLIFKPRPGDIRYNQSTSRLKAWEVEAVEEVLEIYVTLCKRYGGIVKINQFAALTGLNRASLWRWHADNKNDGYIFSISDNALYQDYNNIYVFATPGSLEELDGKYKQNMGKYNAKLSSLRYDCIKRLREEMQDSNTNALALDTMGSMYRANQEPELGRMYEPKRAIYQEQARRMLSAAELVKPEELPGSDTQFSGGRLDILD